MSRLWCHIVGHHYAAWFHNGHLRNGCLRCGEGL